MRPSIAASIRSGTQKTYPVLLIAVVFSSVATIAAAQVTGDVTPEDAEELIRYLKEFAVPRWWMTFAAMCVAPWLLAFTGLGTRSSSPVPTGKGPQLADHLRKVSILGSRYDLDVYTCSVMSEKSWTETITTVDTTTTSIGGNYTPSGSWQTPMSPSTTVSVTSSSIQKDLVRVRYPDRTRDTWEFTNMNFVVAPGDIIALVARKVGKQYECLLAYNQESGQFRSFNLRRTHAISGRLSWIVVTVVGALGASWGWSAAILELINDVGPQLGLPAGTPATPMDKTLWITAFVIASIVASVPLYICGQLLPRIRTMIFKTTVMPGVKHFLEVATTDAKRSFPLEWEGKVAPAAS
jgi:hypothetical protein